MASTAAKTGMGRTHREASVYIRREASVSVVISALLSLLIFLAIFGERQSVAVWGVGQWVFDFLPQGFMVALMCALVPGLLTAARMRRGILAYGAPAAPPVSTIVVRALCLAASAALLGTALIGGAIWATNIVSLAPAAALGLKVAYAVLLALLITPHAVRTTLFHGHRI